MPLTGRMLADFSEFVSECNKGEKALTNIDAESKKVAASIDKITDEPPLRLVKGAAVASDAVKGLSRSIAETDNVLDAFGVHLGDTRRALEDIGNAGGKTVTELGLIGTATLSAGAAMAGWNIGRKVAELLELDKAVANSAARLIGWSDLAAQEAAAKSDALAAASKKAGYEVQSMAEAMRVNAEFAAKMAEEQTKAADAAKKLGDAEKQAAVDALNAEAARISTQGQLGDTQQKIADAEQKAIRDAEAARRKSFDAWFQSENSIQEDIRQRRLEESMAANEIQNSTTAMEGLAVATELSAEKAAKLHEQYTLVYESAKAAQMAGLGDDIKKLMAEGHTMEEAFRIRTEQVYGSPNRGGPGQRPNTPAPDVQPQQGWNYVAPTVNVNVSGVMDPSTKQELATIIKTELMKPAMRGRTLPA